MNTKILSIILAIVGVVSIGLLMGIINTGDDPIKAGEGASIVNGLMYVGYIVLGIVLAAVVIFTLVNIIANPANLKRTLINLGVFVLLVIICFAMAKGVETPLKDGETLSASESKWVGAGLYLFYFLIVIAGGTMLFSGIKKMIK